jgi:CheY-like chemotaxis protein
MEIAQVTRTLSRHRPALACTFAFAVFAAVFSTHHIQIWPLGLEKRTTEYGAASTQILVDSPRSSLVDLQQDTVPLATRAAVFAQFMRSNAIREGISRETGFPAAQIVAQGPFTTLGGRQNITRPSEARSNEVIAESDQYRLVFDHQQDLPIVSIFAQAPTADSAVALANGAVAALSKYVTVQESRQAVPLHRRTVIRALGPADGGWVNAGVNPVFMALAFIAALVGGCLLILVGDATKRALRASRGGDSAPPSPATTSDPRGEVDFADADDFESRPPAVGASHRQMSVLERSDVAAGRSRWRDRE